MITCRHAVEWASFERDAGLGFGTRFVLGFHCLTCPKCRCYRTQLAEIDRAVEDYLTERVPDSIPLPDEARERWVRALREESAG